MGRIHGARLDDHRLNTPKRTFGGFRTPPRTANPTKMRFCVQAKKKFLAHFADTYAVQEIGPLVPTNTEAFDVI